MAEKLAKAGARLMVTDIHAAALKDAMTRLGAVVCAPDAVFDQQIEIFAPCALGGILTEDTVGQLSASLICGAANNQLADDGLALRLEAAGITYLPDYVVNAGGIISVASEIHSKPDAWRLERLTAIAARVAEMLTRARDQGQPPALIADQIVSAMLGGRRAA